MKFSFSMFLHPTLFELSKFQNLYFHLCDNVLISCSLMMTYIYQQTSLMEQLKRPWAAHCPSYKWLNNFGCRSAFCCLVYIDNDAYLCTFLYGRKIKYSNCVGPLSLLLTYIFWERWCCRELLSLPPITMMN